MHPQTPLHPQVKGVLAQHCRGSVLHTCRGKLQHRGPFANSWPFRIFFRSQKVPLIILLENVGQPHPGPAPGMFRRRQLTLVQIREDHEAEEPEWDEQTYSNWMNYVRNYSFSVVFPKSQVLQIPDWTQWKENVI